MKTKKIYGWKPDLPDHRDFAYAITKAISLPAKVDLTAQFPAPYDQGQLGSCTANAIGAAFQFELKKQGLKDFMPSRLFIYYNERKMEGTVSRDAGAMIRDGVKTLNKNGVCAETLLPYNVKRFSVAPSIQCVHAALKNKATSYSRLNSASLNDLKTCLASGFPFVFGFSVYDGFESDEVAKTGVLNMPAKGENMLGGHAVCCVGYDDASGRFIVRNSWGADWGQSGYFTIPYEYLTDSNLADDFWKISIVTEA